jgi:sugar phosphate isomerase/epimerase
MEIERREFLNSAFAAAVLAVFGYRTGDARGILSRAGLKVGACDWSLRQEGKPEAFAVAKEIGLEGVEVSLGKGEDKLPQTDPERQKLFIEASKNAGLALASTCLEILHRDNLKAHPKGPMWVEQSIEATAAMGAKVILLPFFGKQAITQRPEQEATAERLKALAPKAEKAGVILGLEDTISAEDNAWIMDQVKSPAVKVYYDSGNSFPKFDIYKEVAWLTGERICQIHLKDGGGLLGQGKIDHPRLVEAILKSGYTGWLMLETSAPGGVKEAFSANASYVRKLVEEKGK